MATENATGAEPTREYVGDPHTVKLEEIRYLQLTARQNFFPENDEDELWNRAAAAVKIEFQPRITEDGSSADLTIRSFVDRSAYAGEPLFEFNVVILARFRTESSDYDARKLLQWSVENGFFLVLPYARETVYSLTSRLKCKPYILPLYTIPTPDEIMQRRREMAEAAEKRKLAASNNETEESQ